MPTVQALAIILASIYVSINLIADLLTLTLNPRLKSLQIRKYDMDIDKISEEDQKYNFESF